MDAQGQNVRWTAGDADVLKVTKQNRTNSKSNKGHKSAKVWDVSLLCLFIGLES